MKTIAELVQMFLESAMSGKPTSMSVSKRHAKSFLAELAREGVAFSSHCIDGIRDPELREIVRTILLSTAGGAALGAAIGSVVGGPAGAPIGAAVGATVGLATGVFAVLVTLRDSGDGRLLVSAG